MNQWKDNLPRVVCYRNLLGTESYLVMNPKDKVSHLRNFVAQEENLEEWEFGLCLMNGYVLVEMNDEDPISYYKIGLHSQVYSIKNTTRA